MPDALKNPPKTGFWRHTESSIRTHEAQAQTWGVNFQRTIRRRNESAYWAPLPRQFDLFRVSMAGQLTGVEAPDTLWRTLQVTPYVVGEGVPQFCDLGTRRRRCWERSGVNSSTA